MFDRITGCYTENRPDRSKGQVERQEAVAVIQVGDDAVLDPYRSSGSSEKQ